MNASRSAMRRATSSCSQGAAPSAGVNAAQRAAAWGSSVGGVEAVMKLAGADGERIRRNTFEAQGAGRLLDREREVY